MGCELSRLLFADEDISVVTRRKRLTFTGRTLAEATTVHGPREPPGRGTVVAVHVLTCDLPLQARLAIVTDNTPLEPGRRTLVRNLLLPGFGLSVSGCPTATEFSLTVQIEYIV